MIGNRLIMLRRRSGLSQIELAKKLNVSSKSIKNWEADMSDPSLKSIIALCDVFHISADDLLGRTSDLVSLAGLQESDKTRLKRAIQALLDG